MVSPLSEQKVNECLRQQENFGGAIIAKTDKKSECLPYFAFIVGNKKVGLKDKQDTIEVAIGIIIK